MPLTWREEGQDGDLGWDVDRTSADAEVLKLEEGRPDHKDVFEGKASVEPGDVDRCAGDSPNGGLGRRLSGATASLKPPSMTSWFIALSAVSMSSSIPGVKVAATLVLVSTEPSDLSEAELGALACENKVMTDSRGGGERDEGSVEAAASWATAAGPIVDELRLLIRLRSGFLCGMGGDGLGTSDVDVEAACDRVEADRVKEGARGGTMERPGC
jgi:hypothetical protein